MSQVILEHVLYPNESKDFLPIFGKFMNYADGPQTLDLDSVSSV